MHILRLIASLFRKSANNIFRAYSGFYGAQSLKKLKVSPSNRLESSKQALNSGKHTFGVQSLLRDWFFDYKRRELQSTG
jgi:hypothetical protein